MFPVAGDKSAERIGMYDCVLNYFGLISTVFKSQLIWIAH